MRSIIKSTVFFCLGIILIQPVHADTLAYLNDSHFRSMWRDPLAGVITQDMTQPYEGTRCTRFNYTMTRPADDPQHPNGWAGFGYYQLVPLDISAFNYITMAIQGPTSANAVLWLAILTKASADTADTIYNYSHYLVPEQIQTPEWVIVNAPLADFDPPLNKAIMKQVDFHIEPKSGISTDTGTFYLDNVLFTSEPVSGVRDFGNREGKTITRKFLPAAENPFIEVFTLSGARVSTGSAVRQSLPAGAYPVTGAGPRTHSTGLLINK